MTEIQNRFRHRLLTKELLVGTFQKTPSMMISEVLASTKIDVVCAGAPVERRIE
jgi:2-keto-3-deoxy-L-rhamnonate aldolase RhmA